MQAIFTRYLIVHYLKNAFIFILAVTFLIFLLDFTEDISRLNGQNFSAGLLALQLAFLHLPYILQEIFPFIALLASVTYLLQLQLRGEFVSLQTCGVSLWKIIAPACILSFLLTVFYLLIVSPFAAKAMEKAETLLAAAHQNVTNSAKLHYIPWTLEKMGQNTMIMGAQSIGSGVPVTARQVTFIIFNAAHNVQSWIHTPQALLKKGYWQASPCYVYQTDKPMRILATMHIPTQLKPQFVEETLLNPAYIPYYALPNKIYLANKMGLPSNKWKTMLYDWLALPFFSLNMTLITACVCSTFERNFNAKKRFCYAILLGFFLYFFVMLCHSFAKAQFLPPFIGSFAPIILGLLASLNFLFKKSVPQ